MNYFRARHRALNRIEDWLARARDDMCRLNAPQDVLEDLAIIAVKLRARATPQEGRHGRRTAND